MTQQFTCEATDCEFEVQAQSKEEVIQYAQQHAGQQHETELSYGDAEEMLRTI